MKKKVLLLASVASMIDQFNKSNIDILLSLDFEVHVACNFEKGNTCTKEKIDNLKLKLDELNIIDYQIDFSRSVSNLLKHLKAYRQVKKIIKENNFDFVHCHSPIGGVVARLACKSTKTRCIYTAHGFHFFKGGPLSSWIIFYPVEKWLSKYTNVLITINEGDYQLALSKFRAKDVIKVPGVGVDIQKFRECQIDRSAYREGLNLLEDDFVILSVGELSINKNHSVIIKAIAKLQDKSIKYLIVGKGYYKDSLEKLIKDLEIDNQVFLLGFRNDIPELCKSVNVFAFPSKREGLGLAAIEAMASGLPIITSNINGINEYSINNITGYSYDPTDIDGFAEGILKLKNNSNIIDRIRIENENLANKYDLANVNEIMHEVYSNIKEKKE